MTDTKPRPRMLEGRAYRLDLEQGHLFVTISDLDDKPSEIFGCLGKAGTATLGMAEALSRMITLHLRRDTPLDEIVHHLEDIGEMQPWPNPQLGEGVMVRGIADGFAKCLQLHEKNRQVKQQDEPGEQEGQEPDAT